MKTKIARKHRSTLSKYLRIEITDLNAGYFKESVRFNDYIIVSEEGRRLYHSPFELLYAVFINLLSTKVKGKDEVIVMPFFEDVVIVKVDSEEKIMEVFFSRGNKKKCAVIKTKYFAGELDSEMALLSENNTTISTFSQTLNAYKDAENFKANYGETCYR